MAAGHCQPVPPLDNGTPTVEGMPESPEAVAGAITWRLNVAPLTLHFSSDPDHRNVYMLGVERQRTDGYLIGAAWFRNSFGQPSGFVYAGQRFERFYGHDPLYLELTAGVLYGYVPPYDHEVPVELSRLFPRRRGGARLAPFARALGPGQSAGQLRPDVSTVRGLSLRRRRSLCPACSRSEKAKAFAQEI